GAYPQMPGGMMMPPAVTPNPQGMMPAAMPAMQGGAMMTVANNGDDAAKASTDARVAPYVADGGQRCWGDDNGCCFANHNHTDQGPCFSQHHYALFGDFLYMRPFDGAGVVFGHLQDGIGPGAIPKGALGIIEPDYAPGFRAGGDFALTC